MTKYKKTAGADADDDARVNWQLQRVWMGNPAFGCGSQDTNTNINKYKRQKRQIQTQTHVQIQKTKRQAQTQAHLQVDGPRTS